MTNSGLVRIILVNLALGPPFGALASLVCTLSLEPMLRARPV
jgi:hypothetical protein